MNSNITSQQPNLIAQDLLGDSRLLEAKRLLLEAVKSHQDKLISVRPPYPHLKQSYAEILAQFAECRGAKLYFPYIGSGIGKGPLVELLDGSVKYDFISGIGPHYWGHSHLDLIEASIDAALSNTIMQGHLQQNGDSLELSQLLIKASQMSHCFLTSSGAMANENALKLIFQKKFPANRLLAFDRCFCGRTLALSQITDKPNFREQMPTTYFVDYIPFFNPDQPEESTQRAVSALKKHLTRYPKQYAAMLFELVQGEGGFYCATREFFTSIMQILKENHIAILDDEVQVFGRTPELFAFQYFQLQDYIDIVTIGKLSQVCATLFKKEFAPQPGLLSQTFTSSTSAIRASIKMINNLLQGGFYGPNGKIQQIHEHFVKNLEEIEKNHPQLLQKGPYGIGSMIAFTPFDGESKRIGKFVQDLFESGVISFVAGSNPTRVRFLVPAGVITPSDIDAACEILEKTLSNFQG